MRRAVSAAAACLLFAPALHAAPPPLPLQRQAVLTGRGQPGTPRPAAPVNFTFLDFPGTSFTGTYGINLGAKPGAKPVVVGAYGPGINGGSGDTFGFALKQKTKNSIMSESYQTILPTMNNLLASDINDSGHITGTFGPSLNHGFLLANGAFTQIDVPYEGAAGTTAEGINNAGVIVGNWYANSVIEHIYTWQKGVFTQVPDDPGYSLPYPGGINNNGDITGVITDAIGVNHGFLLKDGIYTLIDPPGSVYTAAGGLNDSDAVVGIYCTSVQACSTPANGIHGFLYSNGTYTTIDYQGAAETSVDNINNQGVMVGFYVDQTGANHGFQINP
jgi:hypothetical protein